MSRFDLNFFTDTPSFHMDFREEDPRFDLKFDVVKQSGPPIETYTGPYEVIPTLEEPCVLETANKKLTDDVTVHEIPVIKVWNGFGWTITV